ncbi:hypothetical protein JKP88DRAFT_243812 [Tribonema minus]|uniref:Uncharacterized protein n=1 Tax=Tribonema minus TaxID=303371 RepID=A0A835Z7W8_9STRA|nr:hypothetical protein JKP88DRAFT_243812 [Tribonema minus]
MHAAGNVFMSVSKRQLYTVPLCLLCYFNLNIRALREPKRKAVVMSTSKLGSTTLPHQRRVFLRKPAQMSSWPRLKPPAAVESSGRYRVAQHDDHCGPNCDR